MNAFGRLFALALLAGAPACPTTRDAAAPATPSAPSSAPSSPPASVALSTAPLPTPSPSTAPTPTGAAAPSLGTPAATPTDAVRALQVALDAKDLEAAVRAKNFRCEAEELIGRTKHPDAAKDPALVAQIAERLHASFRKELGASLQGMGRFTCATTGVEHPTMERAVVTTACEGPQGKSTQKLMVCRVDGGWHGAFPIE